MNISESLKIAVKCIKANWMRSLLTMLGIIIGITSVIMIIGAVATGTFAVSAIGLDIVNAVVISLASNGLYDGATTIYDKLTKTTE